jgi:hypothetical protein
MKVLGAFLLVAGLATSGALWAADTAPATKPALPACCGDACKKMGPGCCSTDAAGTTTCSMGGSCCIKH